MKYRTIFLILLVVSSTALFLPLMNPSTEVSILPEELITVQINVNRPTITFSTSINSDISIWVTHYLYGDVAFNSLYVFNQDFKLEDLAPGLYELEITSSELGTLTISYGDIYLTTLIIFFLLVIINLFSLYRKLDEIYL